jgi:hypothetical protein
LSILYECCKRFCLGLLLYDGLGVLIRCMVNVRLESLERDRVLLYAIACII